MHSHSTHPVSLVIYARDLKRLAHFYAAVFLLEPAKEGEEGEGADDFALLSSPGIELAIIQAPAVVEEASEADEANETVAGRAPPRPRTETPIKPSFSVQDLDALRGVVESAGGGLKPAGSAWSWLKTRHLDGWDPEGNIFQLRQREA